MPPGAAKHDHRERILDEEIWQLTERKTRRPKARNCSPTATSGFRRATQTLAIRLIGDAGTTTWATGAAAVELGSSTTGATAPAVG